MFRHIASLFCWLYHKWLYCVLFVLLFSLNACSSLFISPQGEVTYARGVQILHSSLPHSKVQVELAQKTLKYDTLVFYISAQIAQQSPKNAPQQSSNFVLSTQCVQAFFENTPLKIFTYEDLLHQYFDFIGILQDFNIPTPTPRIDTQTVFNVMPFYYMPNPGVLYYAPIYSPFFTLDPANVAYSQERRGALKVFLINYLRESTLSLESGAQGGFIALSKSRIKNSGTLELEVHIQEDIHRFYFDIHTK